MKNTEIQRMAETDVENASFETTVTRRNFFKLMGGGVAVALTANDLFGTALLKPWADEDVISSWIHIQEDGKVTVFTGKVEVGQNIRTSLSQIVAEELRVPMSSVEMIMGDTSLTPYDRGTFGSHTTPEMSPILRKAAASLREVLFEMAASSNKISTSLLKSENGEVILPDGRTISYTELSKGKKILKPLTDKAPLTPPDKWKVAGQSIPKVNGRDFITGNHRYASDLTLPGMLYGKILRAPSYGATLNSADTSKAKAIAGITVVEEKDFIGVVGPDSQKAESALWEINAQWKEKSHPSRNTIFDFFKKNARSSRPRE